jgi:hypothetical protein
MLLRSNIVWRQASLAENPTRSTLVHLQGRLLPAAIKTADFRHSFLARGLALHQV